MIGPPGATREPTAILRVIASKNTGREVVTPILVLFNNGIIGAIIDIQVNNIYLRVYLFLAYNI